MIDGVSPEHKKAPGEPEALFEGGEGGGLFGILVADLEAVEVADGFATIVGVAIDEVAGGGFEAIGIPGDLTLGDLAFCEEELCGFEVDLGLVDFLCCLKIPFLGLGFGDLTPAAHLGEEPDSVRIPGVGAMVFEEDIELWHLAFVGLLERK